MRADLLRRVLGDPGIDGGESSLAGHLRRIASGDHSFVGLPIFILRGFAARDLYVRKDGPVRQPADLRGKRMGLYSWVASGSVWYRHFQQYIGIPLDAVEWWVGDIEVGAKRPMSSPCRRSPSRSPRPLCGRDAGRRRYRRDVEPA